MDRQLKNIYDRLKQQHQQNGWEVNESRIHQQAWMINDRLISEASNNVASAASAGAGAGGSRKKSLQLTWSNINLVPVGDPSSVSDWNNFFNTNANADKSFNSVTVVGNVVTLYGATNLTIKSLLFSDNKNPSNNLVSVIDKGSVTQIQYAAFANCDSLTTVDFPSVTSIADVVFAYCDSLTSVNMPELTTTNGLAFYQATGLTSISLPKLTTSSYADFQDCSNLRNVNLPLLETIGDYGFGGCQTLNEVSLPSCQSVGNYCFSGCVSLSTINLPSCVNLGETVSNDNVFDGIHDLTINLTVDPSLLTCDGGNPDGDIVYLGEYNDLFVNGTEINPKLILWIDSGLTASYSGSGATWSNLADYTGLDLAMTDLTFNSGNGGSFIFNGSTSKAISSPATVYHTGGFTAEVWCQFATFSGSLGVFEFDGGGTHYINFQRMSHTDGSNPDKIRWETSSGAGNRLYSTQNMTPGTWFHVAATFNNSTLSSKLYINGVLDNDGTKSSQNLSTTGPVVIGYHDDYMNGKIAIAKFYKKELLSDDVLASFNADKSRFGY